MSTDQQSTGRRLLVWVFVFVGMLLVVSLSKGIWELLAIYDRVDEAEAEVAELQAKQMSLERQLSLRQSEGFVERQIRDKLHLSRPGEQVVVLPETPFVKETIQDEPVEVEPKENWMRWVRLFWE